MPGHPNAIPGVMESAEDKIRRYQRLHGSSIVELEKVSKALAAEKERAAGFEALYLKERQRASKFEALYNKERGNVRGLAELVAQTELQAQQGLRLREANGALSGLEVLEMTSSPASTRSEASRDPMGALLGPLLPDGSPRSAASTPKASPKMTQSRKPMLPMVPKLNMAKLNLSKPGSPKSLSRSPSLGSSRSRTPMSAMKNTPRGSRDHAALAVPLSHRGPTPRMPYHEPSVSPGAAAEASGPVIPLPDLVENMFVVGVPVGSNDGAPQILMQHPATSPLGGTYLSIYRLVCVYYR